MKVKLGYHFNCQYEKTSITFSVAEIKIHPRYVHSSDHLDHDIALIKLSSAVHFNHEISPICLPNNKGKKEQRTRSFIVCLYSQLNLIGVDYNGHVGLVASWNVPPKGQFEMSSINCTPRKYKMPIASGFKCSDMLAVESESCIGVYGSKSVLCAVSF